MIYAYIRVSTDKQTLETQRLEIEKFALNKKFFVDAWVSEIVSGTKAAADRKLGSLLNIIRKSKFPQNPKRSVRFSGKRTKRSVQKRKARNTQKAETKVL